MAESPIAGWQERFPLPESLDNPDFKAWAHELERDENEQLVDELIEFGRPLGITDKEILEEARPLVDKLDTLIGELLKLRPERWPDEYTDWNPGLSPRYAGAFARIFHYPPALPKT